MQTIRSIRIVGCTGKPKFAPHPHKMVGAAGEPSSQASEYKSDEELNCCPHFVRFPGKGLDDGIVLTPKLHSQINICSTTCLGLQSCMSQDSRPWILDN